MYLVTCFVPIFQTSSNHLPNQPFHFRPPASLCLRREGGIFLIFGVHTTPMQAYKYLSPLLKYSIYNINSQQNVDVILYHCNDSLWILLIFRPNCFSPRPIWLVCVSPFVPKRQYVVFFTAQHSRGPMDTWMAWANEDPSKLSWKRTCFKNLLPCSCLFHPMREAVSSSQVGWNHIVADSSPCRCIH